MSISEEFYVKLLKTIEDSNSKQTKEITERIKTEIRVEVDELKKIIKEEANKRTQLEVKYDELKTKYLALDKSLRKNNIIIFGLHNPTENILKDTVEQLNHYLDLNLSCQDVNDVFAIGKQKENRPIIVKFISYITKQQVLRSCKKLKGTNITIAEELNLEERKRNKILRQHLKDARSKECNAYIKGNKLHINDKAYTAEELINNEEDTDLEDIEDISEKDTLPKNITTSSNTLRAKKDEEIVDCEVVENESKKRKITATINKPITRTTTASAAGRSHTKDIDKNREKDTSAKIK